MSSYKGAKTSFYPSNAPSLLTKSSTKTSVFTLAITPTLLSKGGTETSVRTPAASIVVGGTLGVIIIVLFIIILVVITLKLIKHRSER